MGSIEYWLSFKNGTFASTDLLMLLTKNLGFQKCFITSGSHKTIAFTDKTVEALGYELEKKRYFQVNERLDEYGLPGGSSFTFVVPGHPVAPDNIIWRFESPTTPPEDVFNELLSRPDFVFGYAVDAEDDFRQNESWPGNYEIYRLTPEHVKWTKDSSGQRVIDISGNPGRSEVVSNALLAIGWKMWFGKEIQQHFPVAVLSAFDDAYSIWDYPHGVVGVQLFEDPKGALSQKKNRDIQTAFRQHIKMDEFIRTIKQETDQLLVQGKAKLETARESEGLVLPVSPSVKKQGWIARWFGKKTGARRDNEGPGKPISFGYKLCWFAVQANKPKAISRYFPKLIFKTSSWQGADSGLIFISPPVKGWIFIKGKIPATDEPNGIKEVTRLLVELSQAFKIATFFGSHRVVDYYSWALAENGEIIRAYAEVEGNVLLDTGEKHGIEKELIYPHEAEYMADAFQQDIPDEEMVLRIAGDWSLNPMTLDECESAGFGLIGI